MRRGLFPCSLFLCSLPLAAACGSSNAAAPADAGPFDATTDATTWSPVSDAGLDSDAGPGVIPRGARVLGMDINAAKDGDYVQALKVAKTAGVGVTNVNLDWDAIEVPPTDAGAPEGGAPDAGDGITYFSAYLHIANLIFPPSQVAISLAIRPIDGKKSHVPADLAGKSLKDPRVIDRFNRVQDYVFSQIPDLSLATYMVGNEVDAFLGADDVAWQDYTAFYEAVTAHARTKRMGLKVGVAAKWSSYVGTAQTALLTLNASSDVIAVDYLPMNPDFTPRPISSMQGDLEQILAIFPSKPIHFRYAGFPSSPAIASSEAAQADFVGEAFRVWDLHCERVPYFGFFTLNEYGQQTSQDLASALGSSDPRFKEYLRTLGLRTYEGAGADKPAFGALIDAAHARGW